MGVIFTQHVNMTLWFTWRKSMCEMWSHPSPIYITWHSLPPPLLEKRSFPILDISSSGIRSLSIQYVTITYLVGTNQSEIANFWPVTNLTAIIWIKIVQVQRSFPILDISSLGIRSLSVQYVTITYLVGTNQSEIANFWSVTNLTAIIPISKSFPLEMNKPFPGRILPTLSSWNNPGGNAFQLGKILGGNEFPAGAVFHLEWRIQLEFISTYDREFAYIRHKRMELFQR